MSNPMSPAALAAMTSHQMTVSSLYLVSNVILLYDHFLTLASEISCVWSAPWSIPQILFFINRYYPIITYSILFNITNSDTRSSSSVMWTTNDLILPDLQYTRSFCRDIVKLLPGSALIVTVAGQCIMILRVYALCGQNLCLLVFLGILLITEIALWSLNVSLTPPRILPPGTLGCVPNPTVRFQWVYFAFPLIIDGLVFFITLWETRGHHNLAIGTTIMERFRRDGILYFTCIATVNFINLMFSTASDERLNGTASSLATLVTSVMISRLVLNLRTHANQNSTPSGTLIGNLGTNIEISLNNTSNRGIQAVQLEGTNGINDMLRKHLSLPNNTAESTSGDASSGFTTGEVVPR